MLTAWAVLAIVAAQAQPSGGPEPLRRTDIPVALVVSGGVSLGSYEAGLSWAVVRFSRATAFRPAADHGAVRLVAVTGASAGSINGLLSGVFWCSEPGAELEDSADGNMLHDVWMPVGFDGLLPDSAAGYAPGDALLSTRPLLEAFDRFDRRLGGPRPGLRFRPGCRVPIGLTVTRERAAEHEVGGLTLRTQRFALPWRLEVGADGAPRVHSQRLGQDEPFDALDIARADPAAPGAALSWPQVMQGLMASAAFPVAFRPRELCDCTPRCPPADRVASGTCEGPRGPISHLSCPVRSPEGEPLTLCSHRYVDGGIFDNTPVGLGAELTQAVATTQPLQPVTYVYIDPDVRRLRPAAELKSPDRRGAAPRQDLEQALRLAAELVATARTEDLSRTLRSGPWDVTTRGLLYETAAALVAFAEVERDAAVSLGHRKPAPELTLGERAASPAVRGAVGRALLRCFQGRPGEAEAVRQCARELADVMAGRGGPGDGAPPTADEVVLLAEAMRRAGSELPRSRAGRSAQDAETFALEMRVGAVGMTFLADETPRVARGALPEATLTQLRAALLDTVQLGRILGVEVAHLANAAVREQLEALRREPAVAAAAAQASANIAAAPHVLFVPGDLQPVVEALARRGPTDEVAASVRELVRIGPILQAEIVRLNRLARVADGLQQRRSERALILSSRFAPLTGSQLGNFGAFLDRPFREYDYDAGVYDASHAIALAMCEAQAVAGAPPPVRDVRSSNALDLGDLDTQRCVGIALGQVLLDLDLDRSATAGHVFRMLARAELEATVGEAAATRLAGEATWAWLAPPRPPPDDPALQVADVLLAPRVQCGPTNPAPCIRELSFDEFVSALRARGYRPHDVEMRALLDDPDAWTRRTVRRLLDRSYERELAAPASPDVASAVLFAHRVGELWLRGRAGEGPFPAFALDPSTIPPAKQTPSLDRARILAHLVPYRLDLDVARGGVSASWLDPTLWMARSASLVAELTPISYEAKHGRASSSLALMPTLHAAGLSLGAGPKGAVRWGDGTTTVGPSLRVSAFQQRLSIGVGLDSFAAADRDLFVTIGVSDLNGALFWLLGR